jgi:hypothetical protein
VKTVLQDERAFACTTRAAAAVNPLSWCKVAGIVRKAAEYSRHTLCAVTSEPHRACACYGRPEAVLWPVLGRVI